MTKRSQKAQLSQLFDEQNGSCCYCDGPTWLYPRETRQAAMKRFGIPAGVPGCGKMIIAARATREHVVRIADGGKGGSNITMACNACNVRRGTTPPDKHRADMLVLVRAGLHPTNRAAPVDQPQRHLKSGLKALKRLRAGKLIEPAASPEGDEHV